MQNKNQALTTGAATITAPCSSDAFVIYSGATFNFQYADPLSGLGVGDAVAAEAVSSTLFKFLAVTQKNTPWASGKNVGFVTGGTGSVNVRPERVP